MIRKPGSFWEALFFAYLVPLPVATVALRLAHIRVPPVIELFWPAIAVAALLWGLASARDRIPIRLLILAFAFAAMMAIKAVLGFLGKDPLFGANGYFLELKFILFLVIALILATAFPRVDPEKIEPYFLFFAFLQIADWAVVVKAGGAKRTNILSEQNYDGVIILLGYILVLSRKRLNWWKVAVYFAATVCTSSRTGLASFLVLSAFRFSKLRNKFLFAAIVAGIAAVGGIVFMRRLGKQKLEALDRLVMLLQFWDGFASAGHGERAWGIVPGLPLELENDAMDYYIQRQNLPLGLKGLHPFNFHGFLMRFISSYGLASFLLLSAMALKEVKLDRRKVYLILLAGTQMFSLGLFYLTVMAVPLFLLLFLEWEGPEAEGDATSGNATFAIPS